MQPAFWNPGLENSLLQVLEISPDRCQHGSRSGISWLRKDSKSGDQGGGWGRGTTGCISGGRVTGHMDPPSFYKLLPLRLRMRV